MYHKTVLANGLRIVTNEMKERDSVGIGFWVDVGGRYESDEIKGAAHFLEHILFKGSEKYSCKEIKERIEGVGGSLNAFTSEEHTCYFAKIPAKHLKRAFDILADMVFHPSIPPQEVLKERGVIIEEIKMYHDLPQYFVMELLDGLMWPGHPLGKNLAGTVESVSQMGPEHLRRFHDGNYFPKNIVVSICGNVQHEECVTVIKKKLNGRVNSEKKDFLPAGDSQEGPKVHFFKKDIEQMHLALGMFGLDNSDPDRYALGLLSTILGGNMSSRLFDEVREKRGLAYSIASSAKALKDTGIFMIRAGVDNKKIVEAVGVILKEMKKVRKDGVTQDELIRAKDFYLGQILLGLEDTLDHMLWIGESLMTLKRTRTLREVIKRVNAVKMGDMNRIASRILDERRLNLAVVGPLAGSQDKELRELVGCPA
ncbi:MAG: pitrilysin family protein [Candidatus Omnitrophota bacterium]